MAAESLRLPAWASSPRRSPFERARAFELAVQPVDLEFALGEQAALFVEPRFQLVHAAA